MFSPVSVGPLHLDHRIVMGSMHLNREDDPRALAAFYRERAAGGAGLIITGGAAVSRAGAGGPNYLLINEPAAAAVMAPVLDAVHDAGGKLALQLFHAGRYAFEASFGIRPVAPSEVYSAFSQCLPRALTQAQIEDTLADFAAGAAAARALGFDAVEIMGSEGYLINQFASPLTNRRRDRWGGDPQHRQAFPRAVLKAVREAVGTGYPVIYRTSGADFTAGSSTRAESADLAVALARDGADAVNVGIGWHESRVPSVQALVPPGRWLDIAGGIRGALAAAEVQVPVIGSNRINSLESAERALAAGHADLISMARPFLADPDIVAKSRRGESHLVNTCIACNEACIDRSLGTEPVSCLVNPRAGRETVFPLRAVPPPAGVRVAVVGAGPAGMQAAATLAEAGHPVDLYEREGAIGGQFRLAGQVPGKAGFLQTIRYFTNELARLGVHVLTGAAPGVAHLARYAHVVLATGVRPRPVPLPGSGLLPVLDYRQAFADPARLGARVVIVGAGGIAVDLSRLLVDPGAPGGARDVTILRRGSRIGAGIGPSTRWAVLQEIRAAGVRTMPGTTPLELSRHGLRVRDGDGAAALLPADAVVLAAGQVPHNPLHAPLAVRGVPCTVIGGALDASGLNAVRAFDQGLSAGTAVARQLTGRTPVQPGVKSSRTPLP
ncbi:oxidoreductase [Arthrobacter zhaoxinii]|uniref:oxidoreductase n=1 Tax=Arthrobacter zhaoxinii TaxID=2964616 RepID=UPI0021042F30|nr:FAD-dependent oxidoreductase [Arthrobacter zhaoxinii]MCQ1999461.1 FAD-dependent oxidoreductase [Arthrobacter zhaoxinii]